MNILQQNKKIKYVPSQRSTAVSARAPGADRHPLKTFGSCSPFSITDNYLRVRKWPSSYDCNLRYMN